MSVTSETCESCRYWIGGRRDGGCHRFPPIIREERPGPLYFPATLNSDWCGEWAAKDDGENSHADPVKVSGWEQFDEEMAKIVDAVCRAEFLGAHIRCVIVPEDWTVGRSLKDGGGKIMGHTGVALGDKLLIGIEP